MDYKRTLLKRRQVVSGLLVRLRLVERDPDRDNVLPHTSAFVSGIRGVNHEERASYRKIRLEARVPLDRLLHRTLVQLVCEQDTPDPVELSPGQVFDE